MQQRIHKKKKKKNMSGSADYNIKKTNKACISVSETL